MQIDSVHVEFSVPASVAGPSAGDRARLPLVLDPVRSERISWHEGARILGLAPSASLDLARDHGVPVVRLDEGDLATDLETLERLSRSR